MGLDTTHDAWHGAYSAFYRWRDKLAETAGYDVVTLDAKVHGRSSSRPCLDWGGWPEEGYYDPPFIPCRVDGTPDPLLLLIMHSDCEGKIRAEFLPALVKRLEELVPALQGQDGGGHVGDYGDKTLTFIAGLQKAIGAGEDLGFH